jgi:hypothetical protein
MRQNDIPLPVLPTHHSKSLLSAENTSAHRRIMGSSSRKLRLTPVAGGSDGDSTSNMTTTETKQRYHEILNRLKLLSIISSTLPFLSLEQIATSLLHDIYSEYNRLRKSDLALLREGYELFKEYQYERCLVEYRKGYQMSCLIEFIEREYWTEIEDGVMRERQKKKTLLQKLEEEREEMKLACMLSYLPPLSHCTSAPPLSTSFLLTTFLSSVCSSHFLLTIPIDVSKSKGTTSLSSTLLPSKGKDLPKSYSENQSTQRTSTGLVSYQCGIIQTIQEHMKHQEDYIEHHATEQEKYEHETRREIVFKVTKKCLGILSECSWEKVDLSRESRHIKGR